MPSGALSWTFFWGGHRGATNFTGGGPPPGPPWNRPCDGSRRELRRAMRALSYMYSKWSWFTHLRCVYIVNVHAEMRADRLTDRRMTIRWSSSARVDPRVSVAVRLSVCLFIWRAWSVVSGHSLVTHSMDWHMVQQLLLVARRSVHSLSKSRPLSVSPMTSEGR